MKINKCIISLIIGLSTGCLAVGAAEVTAKAQARSSKATKTSKEVELGNTILGKRFCVALRRGDQASLREMIDPEDVKAHGKRGKVDAVIRLAPVNGIYNIMAAKDGATVLCLYRTDDEQPEALVLRTVWRKGRPYILPPDPPESRTSKIEPWILRTDLSGFIATVK